MADKYQVLEILKDVEGKKVTWESQDYKDYRAAHRVKSIKTKHNSNPDVEYEIKHIQGENAQKSYIGMMK